MSVQLGSKANLRRSMVLEEVRKAQAMELLQTDRLCCYFLSKLGLQTLFASPQNFPIVGYLYPEIRRKMHKLFNQKIQQLAGKINI